ncbi:MAG: DUF4178 domain-containing protein [Bacteroidota bacterium]
MGNISGFYQCPACSSPVTFRHADTNYIACKQCTAILHRKDGQDLRAVNFDRIPDQNSVIKTGSKGVWEGVAFEVLGRVRFWMTESVCNYWTISFANGKLAMLAEGYGMYSILTPTTTDKHVTKGYLDGIKPGMQQSFESGKTHIAVSKDEAKRCEVEGEFRLPGWRGSMLFFEYMGTDGTGLELHLGDASAVTAYKTIATSHSILQLTNTRSTPYTDKRTTCSICKKNNVLKTSPFAQSFGCSGCKTRYIVNSKEHVIISGTNGISADFDLDIGQKANLFNVSYELVGCCLKEETGPYKSQWKEYTLYNSLDGFAFLSEFQGHWTFVREQKETPVLLKDDSNSLEHGGVEFHIYNDYRFRILDSRGEFPYNIYDNESTHVREFIAPPEMWIREKSRNEGISWYHGSHIGKNEIEKAFGKTVPQQIGIGAIQPGGMVDRRKLKLVCIALVVMAFAVHLVLSAFMQEKEILTKTFTIGDTAASAPSVTPQFTLTKWRSNLEFQLAAPVQNSWFSLDINMVNAGTGEEFSIDEGVEYYSGYESGESWAEGGKETSTYLSSIPAGTYFLKLQPSADPNRPIPGFSLRVVNDVPMTRNIIIIMILLLILPVGTYIRSWLSDRKRWENSDFSPYNYDES